MRQEVFFFLRLIAAVLVFGTVTGDARAQPLTAEESLGQAIFNDPELSRPPGQSCASCHDATAGFADSDTSRPTSKGALSFRFGPRNSPSVAYLATAPDFFRDPLNNRPHGGFNRAGEKATLAEQAKGPFLNPLEMNEITVPRLISKVRARPYAADFRAVYGPTSLDNAEVAFDFVAQALAAFQRSPLLSPFTSKYDAFLAGTATLTDREARGLALFENPNKGNCNACHLSRPAEDGAPPLFTDFAYINVGVPKNVNNKFYTQDVALNPEGANYLDLGLVETTGINSDRGRFKIPTLRNIALTAPYMHNGYFASLKGVVDFYNTRDVKPRCADPLTRQGDAQALGCWPAPEISTNISRTATGSQGLTQSEINSIVEFLRTLTDGWQPPVP